MTEHDEGAPRASDGRFSKNIYHVDPSSIMLGEDRQRTGGKALDTSDLEPSVKARGIFNPIIVRRDMTLVAGERRTRTALKLRLPSVPIRYYEDLDPIECKIIELEENERRTALEWKDHARAISSLHELYAQKAGAAGWSAVKTAEMLFYGAPYISKCLRVAKDITSPRITNAPGLIAAYNILQRLDERRIGDAMNEINMAGVEIEFPDDPPPPQAEPQPAPKSGVSAAPPSAKATLGTTGLGFLDPKHSIRVESFLDWAPHYAGQPFTLVHCDFPYGTRLFHGPQSGRDKWQGGGYDDDPDVYWALIRCFCKHRDKFLARSAHIMFWFDMDYYEDTLQLFAELAPELNFHKKPLIWLKSDNVGILPDPKRGPRHIYESCFIATRGDRFIIQATSDAYSCPTDKSLHPSTKPEPMLRNFMRMFVDEYTTILDPTCGSAASLRAAESLGAKHVFGLEINEDYAEAARTELRKARLKIAGSGVAAGPKK